MARPLQTRLKTALARSLAGFFGGTERKAVTRLPKLPNLAESEALLLVPSDPRHARYQPAYNRRTTLQPALRAVCRTDVAVARLIDWARTNNLSFALRSGGHSFEGLSQSTSVVIDVREMSEITIDPASGWITVGAGASLGAIYKFLAPRGLVLPAGTCPRVGIAGHTLGGGYGLLSRSLGLTCDSLLSIELVDPAARHVTTSASEVPDLFWASRGGGGGSFGAATRFRFQTYRQPTVLVFSAQWQVPADRALRLFKAWQEWSPHAPAAITAAMTVVRAGKGLSLSCAGHSLGTRAGLMSELNALLAVDEPSAPPALAEVPFLSTINFSSGRDWKYSKGKSDFVLSPLSDDGIGTLLAGLLSREPGSVVAACDPYGGAISRPASADTAFPYRAGTLYCIQYSSSWRAAGSTARRLADISAIYASMRPYVAGAAYVNYCDLDLDNWQTAYWGTNLARLSQVKAAFDPENVFCHAQGVPSALDLHIPA